jgi:transcription-repair coupling factor (superfamily II helicase)
VGPLGQGFHAAASRLAVVTADELFGAKEKAKGPKRSVKDAALGTLAELKADDLVVHSRHGVGRFIGLKRVRTELKGESPRHDKVIEQDYAELSFRGNDRLFLPVTRLDEITKYRATGETEPALDKLGGITWAARKSKARERIAALAHELLSVHALRSVGDGHAYDGDLPALYRQLEETFPFEETPDQAAAIIDVLDDLAKPEPMDRLIVGDVGFGKTEVALRAAMRVLLEGRQVAVLCPTTVLAFQHHETFRERLSGFGLRVELLSGFRSAALSKTVLTDLAEGKVDVLVGTQALLGRQVRWKRLGLVVVDEEHRFGVKQKERLKKTVAAWATTPPEYLAMSATPIPRSLHMAMSGLRDVSMITTPPQGRKPVLTRILVWNDERIREEITHELHRGGQVFFVHNRVETLGSVSRRLQEIVPEAKIGVGHGQMADGALEAVLVDFIRRQTNVLLCTTIIESGIDMPNVNTILVNDAHELGLAQLHQLRGRVGRGPVRGYCTLLVPEEAGISAKAVRRLRALQDYSELGSGMAIASADLELRGSGDLLGESQHGHIEAVGLDVYIELLEEAIAVARGQIKRARLDPEIDVSVPQLIPERWIEEVGDRLTEYRRLAACKTVSAVRDLIDTWEDQHGKAPPEVLNLGWAAEARLRARELGIERVAWLKVKVVLDFHESTQVPPALITKLVSEEKARFALGGPRKVEVRFTKEEAEYPFRFLHWVFRRFEA